MTRPREKYFAIGLAVMIAAVVFTRPGTVGEHFVRFLVLYSVPLALLRAWFAGEHAMHGRRGEARIELAHAVFFVGLAGFGASIGNGWLRLAWLALAFGAQFAVHVLKRREEARTP